MLDVCVEHDNAPYNVGDDGVTVDSRTIVCLIGVTSCTGAHPNAPQDDHRLLRRATVPVLPGHDDHRG